MAIIQLSFVLLHLQPHWSCHDPPEITRGTSFLPTSTATCDDFHLNLRTRALAVWHCVWNSAAAWGVHVLTNDNSCVFTLFLNNHGQFTWVRFLNVYALLLTCTFYSSSQASGPTCSPSILYLHLSYCHTASFPLLPFSSPQWTGCPLRC